MSKLGSKKTVRVDDLSALGSLPYKTEKEIETDKNYKLGRKNSESC